MQTLRLSTSEADLARAAEILRTGGLVAFPTETVYGLGANALEADAVQKIFEAKERPAWDPLIVHVASREMLRDLFGELPAELEQVKAFMPGPLTVLLARPEKIPLAVTAGRDKLAVRMPAHPVARALIERAGVPLAAPSANRFSRPSPTTADHVLADLAGRIDAVVDGGPAELGVESTVLDLLASPPLILRAGGTTREQLEHALGRVELYDPEMHTEGEPREGLPSPGVGIRHYAPRVPLVLVDGDEASLSGRVRNSTGRVGVMLPSGWKVNAGAAVLFDWGDWEQPEVLASRLFAGLRYLEDEGVEAIICPLPQPSGIGLALRDRLRKASF